MSYTLERYGCGCVIPLYVKWEDIMRTAQRFARMGNARVKVTVIDHAPAFTFIMDNEVPD